MNATYQSPSQTGTWNGWIEPTQLPTFEPIYQDLICTIDKELADVPIQQQTVIVAALWDMDTWGVEVLTAPPITGRYDGWTECLIDFDQYHGSLEDIRQGTAEALADELMNKAFPGWQDPDYGKPEPDWEADWH